MRLQGMSRSQIVAELGLKSGGAALSRWLQGVAPPEWTKRPNAKDDLRYAAVQLRRAGLTYSEIVEGVEGFALALVAGRRSRS
jgi:transcriptional regulator with XRE-family HTH domain